MGWDGAEDGVCFPGLGSSTHDDFLAGDLCEHAPTEGGELFEEAFGRGLGWGAAAEESLAAAEECADDCGAFEVGFECGGEDQVCWCVDGYGVALCDFEVGHEGVEERVVVARFAFCVGEPGGAHVGGVDGCTCGQAGEEESFGCVHPELRHFNHLLSSW